jgi:hypothetical protein
MWDARTAKRFVCLHFADVSDHFNGTDRDATATGSFAGIALRASQLEFADLGHTNEGSVFICKGTGF